MVSLSCCKILTTPLTDSNSELQDIQNNQFASCYIFAVLHLRSLFFWNVPPQHRKKKTSTIPLRKHENPTSKFHTCTKQQAMLCRCMSFIAYCFRQDTGRNVIRTGFIFMARQPQCNKAPFLSRIRDYTHWKHQTRQDSSGRVIGPSHNFLPHNTQHSQGRDDIHALGGIRTRIPQQASWRRSTTQTARSLG